jgi:hypothetical protein
MNGHPEDDIKRQRTQYNGDQLYSNVSNARLQSHLMAYEGIRHDRERWCSVCTEIHILTGNIRNELHQSKQPSNRLICRLFENDDGFIIVICVR